MENDFSCDDGMQNVIHTLHDDDDDDDDDDGDDNNNNIMNKQINSFIH